MIRNGLVSEMAESPREERNLGDQTLVIVVTLEMNGKSVKWSKKASEAKKILRLIILRIREVFIGEDGNSHGEAVVYSQASVVEENAS
ncbi:hypothetical protein Tco_0011164 [Tanacetum coccineum]